MVSAVEKEGMTLVCCLLNCPTTYERTMQLFDDAFSAYQQTLLLGKDTILEVTDGKNKWKGISNKDFYYPLLAEEKELVEIKTHPINAIKLKNIIGQFEIYLAKRLLFSGNLYKL